jgi:hypothetical protein
MVKNLDDLQRLKNYIPKEPEIIQILHRRKLELVAPSLGQLFLSTSCGFRLLQAFRRLRLKRFGARGAAVYAFFHKNVIDLF